MTIAVMLRNGAEGILGTDEPIYRLSEVSNRGPLYLFAGYRDYGDDYYASLTQGDMDAIRKILPTASLITIGRRKDVVMMGYRDYILITLACG